MKEKTYPSIAPAVVFTVLALIFFLILAILSWSIFSMRCDAVSSTAESAAGLALGLVLMLPFTLIALGVESLFSVVTLVFSIRLIKLGMGKVRKQGIVMTVIAGVCLLLGVGLFFGSVYFPVETFAGCLL